MTGRKGFMRAVVKIEAVLKVQRKGQRPGRRPRGYRNHVVLLACGHRVVRLFNPGCRLTNLLCTECRDKTTAAWGMQ